MLLFPLFPLILLFSLVSAGPTSASAGFSIPLTRRKLAPGHRIESLKAQADALRVKYATPGHSTVKRANTGTEPLTNQHTDITYYGTVAVGTPAQNLDVILDTGSSDLWIVSSNCQQGCVSLGNTFNASESSTFKDSQRSIHIKYGSGEVAGEIGTDTVTLAGFTVQNQSIGVMNNLTTQIVSGAISGIMGLGWAPLAQTGGMPWWESLAKGGSCVQPLFGFYLTRYADDPNAPTTVPGGSMDIGFVNSSFTNISYVSLTSQTYWNIPLQTITINGSEIQSGAGAAIDTGTSLIGGPSSMMEELYSHIPGATRGTGQLQDFYLFSCSHAPHVSLTFGGQAYHIDPADFARVVGEETCVGAFFPLDVGSSSGISWVVGDAFLKNVYSVFRYSPPAVGFQAVGSRSGGGNGMPTSSGSSTATTTTSTTSSSVVVPTSTFTVFVPPEHSVSSSTTSSLSTSRGAASQVAVNAWGAAAIVVCLCGGFGFGL